MSLDEPVNWHHAAKVDGTQGWRKSTAFTGDPIHDELEHLLAKLTELEIEREAVLVRIREIRAQHVDQYDPDSRGADDDDRRLSLERAEPVDAA